MPVCPVKCSGRRRRSNQSCCLSEHRLLAPRKWALNTKSMCAFVQMCIPRTHAHMCLMCIVQPTHKCSCMNPTWVVFFCTDINATHAYVFNCLCLCVAYVYVPVYSMCMCAHMCIFYLCPYVNQCHPVQVHLCILYMCIMHTCVLVYLLWVHCMPVYYACVHVPIHVCGRCVYAPTYIYCVVGAINVSEYDRHVHSLLINTYHEAQIGLN